jgi:hypothetical protein
MPNKKAATGLPLLVGLAGGKDVSLIKNVEVKIQLLRIKACCFIYMLHNVISMHFF